MVSRRGRPRPRHRCRRTPARPPRRRRRNRSDPRREPGGADTGHRRRRRNRPRPRRRPRPSPQPATEKTPSEPQPPARRRRPGRSRPRRRRRRHHRRPRRSRRRRRRRPRRRPRRSLRRQRRRRRRSRGPPRRNAGCAGHKGHHGSPAPATKEPRHRHRPAAAVSPAAGDVPTTPLPRPALVPDDRRAETYGPAWLPPGQQVNAEQFEAFVVSPSDAQSGGARNAERLNLPARVSGSPVGAGGQPAVAGPGGAGRCGPDDALRATRARAPAAPAWAPRGVPASGGRLDQTVPVDIFEQDHAGQLLPAGRCDASRCGPLLLPRPVDRRSSPRCLPLAQVGHTSRVRAPAGGTRPAAAQTGCGFYRRQPPVRPNRLLLELQVPRDRAIDVLSTADVLAPLTHVRTRAEQLRAAQVELILGSRSDGRSRSVAPTAPRGTPRGAYAGCTRGCSPPSCRSFTSSSPAQPTTGRPAPGRSPSARSDRWWRRPAHAGRLPRPPAGPR